MIDFVLFNCREICPSSEDTIQLTRFTIFEWRRWRTRFGGYGGWRWSFEEMDIFNHQMTDHDLFVAWILLHIVNGLDLAMIGEELNRFHCFGMFDFRNFHLNLLNRRRVKSHCSKPTRLIALSEPFYRWIYLCNKWMKAGKTWQCAFHQSDLSVENIEKGFDWMKFVEKEQAQHGRVWWRSRLRISFCFHFGNWRNCPWQLCLRLDNSIEVRSFLQFVIDILETFTQSVTLSSNMSKDSRLTNITD